MYARSPPLGLEVCSTCSRHQSRYGASKHRQIVVASNFFFPSSEGGGGGGGVDEELVDIFQLAYCTIIE